jgi:UDP-glucose 4-epimerase
MKEKIFLTGGAGFIGSHIAESLVKAGYQVTVYDNFSSGRMENLAAVKKDIRLVKGDILDYAKLRKAMAGCAIVSHQAAQLEIFRCLDNPQLDLRTNTSGSLNVFRAAAENRVKRVINASSACVYGQAEYTPQDEGHPLNPNWPYGVSKLAAEKYGRILEQDYAIPVISLRYGIVYGEREWLGRVLTMFLRRVVLQGKPPVIFGSGGQLRDFIYVGDAVKLHNLCLAAKKGGVYNVSTARGTSVRELAVLVLKAAGKKYAPIFEQVKEGRASKFMPERKRIPQELKRMVLSFGKAQEAFGWHPEMDLQEGVRRETEWISRHRHYWRHLGEVAV